MQPAAIDDGTQISQVGVLVVVDQEKIHSAGGESFLPQHIQSAAAVADRPDDAGDAVPDTGVRPDAAGHLGVGGGQFHREHPCRRRRPRDAQRAVAAVGSQFQCQPWLGSLDGCVE